MLFGLAGRRSAAQGFGAAMRSHWMKPAGCVLALGLLLSACVGEVGQHGDTGPKAGGPSSTGGGNGVAPPGGGSSATGPGPTNVDPQSCSQSLPAARIWRISDQQYVTAVADLLPGATAPEITTPGRSRAEFINVADLYPVSGALAVDLRTAAKAIAASTVGAADLGKRLGCAGAVDRGCASAFVQRFVARAFRRPLEPVESEAFTKLFDFGTTTSVNDGVRLVIEATLQAPSFLYRTELGRAGDAGKPATALTPFELASSLSFFFLDSIPDDGLWQAAMDGSLARPEIYERETKRLLGLPRVRQNLAHVFMKWIGLGAGVTTELASEDYPDYNDDLRASLTAESAHFFADAVAQGQGSPLGDLFTTRKTFIDQRLAKLYGLPYTGPAGGFVDVNLPAGERAGFFTQAGFVVSKSRGEVVVHRGKWMRQELLCGDIPDPLPGVNTEPPVGDFTPRQLSELRMSSSTCGACHALMDGLGLAFSHYDAMGRYLAKDAKGAPVDASGVIQVSDFDGPVRDAVDLAQKLSRSNQARLCIETRMLAYALGRDTEPGRDDCTIRQIDDQIKAGGGRLLDLMSAIALAPAFRSRGGQP
jgi:hypothetical protein